VPSTRLDHLLEGGDRCPATSVLDEAQRGFDLWPHAAGREVVLRQQCPKPLRLDVAKPLLLLSAVTERSGLNVGRDNAVIGAGCEGQQRTGPCRARPRPPPGRRHPRAPWDTVAATRYHDRSERASSSGAAADIRAAQGVGHAWTLGGIAMM